ncbi:MAG TPA: ATP-binding protein, partial [Burkholderiales bacterium]|nr:ATP-binding protein [Burkholderiales bacterium]
GGMLYTSVSGVPVFDERGGFKGYEGVASDITQRKLAEQALREAQDALTRVNRVATLGVLAASIAHEVNQPLGAIVTSAASCARWLAAQPPDIEKARRSLERIERDGQRAGEIIHRIRALVKRQTPRREWLEINEAILEVIALTRDEVRRNDIALETRLAQDLRRVHGDRVQLQQVMLNLIANAVEAMSVVDDRPRQLTIASMNEGQREVRVEVRDSGPGVAAERAEKLFEAFYTTKAEGIGMGLSISRSIIEAHGGRLWATANVPHGAVFQFSLPIDDNSYAADAGGS